MLSDRHYMRDSDTPVSQDPINWLMGILVAVFVAEHASVGWFKSAFLFEHFGYSVDHLRHGEIWTLLSYNFISDISYYGGFFNLIINLLVLHFCGRAVIGRTSRGFFLLVYFGLILAGALAWSAGSALKIYWPIWDPSIAGAGVFALFCCFFSNEPMTFLLFFLLPVTLKPKHYVWILAGVDLFGFIFYEMAGSPSTIWNGHLARLGAMGAAVGFYFLYERRMKYGLALSSSPAVELPRWLRKTPRAARPPGYRVNLSNRDDLRAEVDRILDKINSAGFGALTPDERQILDEAKDLLSRR
ncbi:MAG TPA: rhomboid family intramembrane serine protease [Opitutaceae bacterium]|jgi:membrane associated rhomboid family serine protease|nr:rhomboid family intramembrane serine protease [Opitutaceae bacterium]